MSLLLCLLPLPPLGLALLLFLLSCLPCLLLLLGRLLRLRRSAMRGAVVRHRLLPVLLLLLLLLLLGWGVHAPIGAVRATGAVHGRMHAPSTSALVHSWSRLLHPRSRRLHALALWPSRLHHLLRTAWRSTGGSTGHAATLLCLRKLTHHRNLHRLDPLVVRDAEGPVDATRTVLLQSLASFDEVVLVPRCGVEHFKLGEKTRELNVIHVVDELLDRQGTLRLQFVRVWRVINNDHGVQVATKLDEVLDAVTPVHRASLAEQPPTKALASVDSVQNLLGHFLGRRSPDYHLENLADAL
mmetsp:Transcript_37137/g.80401  ORF Transcript_37137/g.80401 Transcript_37137/m.80401 type:complete len:298 (+) Transcript_37137:1381-2274(+)